jgi:hypothetical protein
MKQGNDYFPREREQGIVSPRNSNQNDEQKMIDPKNP